MFINPPITVLMPVYNSEAFLNAAIESVLNQTFTNFEFLIVNDGSTDSSLDIITSYKDKRIKIKNNNQNTGITKSLNMGLNLAKGIYIARMDADDISRKDRLEIQYNYITKNPDTVLVGSWVTIINNKGQKLNEAHFNCHFSDIFGHMFLGNQFAHSSVFFKKDVINNIGGYDNSFKSAQDYDLWFRVLEKKYKAANIPEFLVDYRDHNDNISNIKKSNQEYYACLSIKNAYNNIFNKKITIKNISLIRKYIFEKKHMSIWKLILIYYCLNKLKNSLKKIKIYDAANFEFLNNLLTKFLKASINLNLLL